MTTSIAPVTSNAQGNCVGTTPADRFATDSFHALCIRPTLQADGTTFINRLGKPANVLATSSYAICESGDLRQAPMSIVADWFNGAAEAKLTQALDAYDGQVSAKLRAYLHSAMQMQLTVEAPQTFAQVQAELAALKAAVAAGITISDATK